METRSLPEDERATTLSAQLAELANRPVVGGRVDRVRRRLLELAQRATSWGPLAPAAEIGWLVLRRDATNGGSVLAAALAYRIFVWVLPLALVAVLGLGLAAAGTGAPSDEVVDAAGITGIIAGSISSTADRATGWGAAIGLVVALLVLVYVTFALLRALRAVTALAWRLPVRPPAHPARDTLLFLAGLVGFLTAAALASGLRDRLELPADLLAVLAAYTVLPAFFFVLSLRLLPHAAEHWKGLVPGAILAGLGLAAVGLFNSLVLFPWLSQKEETYGVLGVAAGLLFGFFLVGRTIELAAALNAVLSEGQRRRTLAR